MSCLDEFLERNKKFAAAESSAGALLPLPEALPNVRAIVVGCADMRVDPAHVLGLRPGEAVVMRNIGGRITPGLLEQLGLLGRIGQVAKHREPVVSSTSSSFSTPTAESPVLPVIPPC